MQIVINKVGAPFKDGKYMKMELGYSRDGKDTTRKLVAVGDTKPVFEILKGATAGEVYDIEMVREGEYWNWVGAKKAEGPARAPVAKGTSTYETADERALRNLRVNRSYSINQAIAALGVGKDFNDYAELAQKFVDFVYKDDDEAGAEGSF